jgi:threonine/homoserine/homoserine lactone efflux protein
MLTSFPFLIYAISLGLSAGISPGPILALVVSQSLKYGKKEGIKLALVPLITDIPIILISLFLLKEIAHHEQILGIISFLGGVFLVYLAYGSVFIKQESVNIQEKPRSFRKGIITNMLSPHPYLFWIFIGSNLLLQAVEISLITAILFVFIFYLCLVGSKIIIAWLTSRFRNILSSSGYTLIIRILGIILFLLAIELFIKSVNYIF